MSGLNKHGHDDSQLAKDNVGRSHLNMQSIIRDYRLFLETTLIVVCIVLIKLAADRLDYEFINVSSLFTSVIAGGVFVISIILSGVIADYKESEKIPSDIAAALESIYVNSRQARWIRKAISPRLAIRIFLNMGVLGALLTR